MQSRNKNTHTTLVKKLCRVFNISVGYSIIKLTKYLCRQNAQCRFFPILFDFVYGFLGQAVTFHFKSLMLTAYMRTQKLVKEYDLSNFSLDNSL